MMGIVPSLSGGEVDSWTILTSDAGPPCEKDNCGNNKPASISNVKLKFLRKSAFILNRLNSPVLYILAMRKSHVSSVKIFFRLSFEVNPGLSSENTPLPFIAADALDIFGNRL